MRKSVSMVAVASAAFGAAACSTPHRSTESAAAATPLGTRADAQADSRAEAAHARPVPVAQAAASTPQAPTASGAAPARPAAAGSPRAGQDLQPGVATSVGAPVLIPSGTADAAGHAADRHRRGAHPGAPDAQGPAAPQPAPPPPAAQNRPAHSVHAATTAGAASTAGFATAAAQQIVAAVAAAHADGKAVLLDYGASGCAACQALDKGLRTPKAQAVLAGSYHVVHIDLGEADPQLLALAGRYDPSGSHGMPLLVVLNPDGTVRADSARVGQPPYDEAGLAAWLTRWGTR